MPLGAWTSTRQPLYFGSTNHRPRLAGANSSLAPLIGGELCCIYAFALLIHEVLQVVGIAIASDSRITALLTKMRPLALVVGTPLFISRYDSCSAFTSCDDAPAVFG